MCSHRFSSGQSGGAGQRALVGALLERCNIAVPGCRVGLLAGHRQPRATGGLCVGAGAVQQLANAHDRAAWPVDGGVVPQERALAHGHAERGAANYG